MHKIIVKTGVPFTYSCTLVVEKHPNHHMEEFKGREWMVYSNHMHDKEHEPVAEIRDLCILMVKHKIRVLQCVNERVQLELV